MHVHVCHKGVHNYECMHACMCVCAGLVSSSIPGVRSFCARGSSSWRGGPMSLPVNPPAAAAAKCLNKHLRRSRVGPYVQCMHCMSYANIVQGGCFYRW